jgi:hypothetical protein
VQIGGHATGFGATTRNDKWWVAPLLTALGFTAFIVYSTWAGFQGRYYYHEPYISPMYAPVLLTDPSQPGSAPADHAWFGLKPTWWPSFLPFSPAFLILAFPGSFRITCYYYRKAYYRSYFLDPPACAVTELRGTRYRGETAFPLILQNLHRYLFFITLGYLPFLWADVVHASIFEGRFGIGVGTLVILANTVALTLYSFSCHSARHLVGGRLDCFSCSAVNRARHTVWQRASTLNERHMLFAWMSFVSVCGADLYVRLVASGRLTDVRLL